jgi:hypothetical protein
MAHAAPHDRSRARRAAWLAPLVGAASTLLAACTAAPEAIALERKADLGTAPITHLVLIQLKDPSRVQELVADCDRALPSIEAVAAYSCGVPLVSKRVTVLNDYDVGIYVGFRTNAEYRAYLEDPRHTALVERWRDGWKAVRIFDLVDGTEGKPAGDESAPVEAQARPEQAAAAAEPPAAAGSAPGTTESNGAAAAPKAAEPTPAAEPAAPPKATGAAPTTPPGPRR